MRKNICKKILVSTCVIVLLIIGGSIIGYVSNTYPASEMKEYCLSNASENSIDFSPLGVNKLEGYRFWVAENEDSVYQQEMFIFRKELLWGIFDLERFSFVHQVVGSEGQMVSSVQFDAQSQFADEETTVVLFFSSNPKMITHYKIKFQENGVYGEITGGVSQEDPFVVGITEVGSYDYISRVYEGAEFYDENYQILESEGK